MSSIEISSVIRYNFSSSIRSSFGDILIMQTAAKLASFQSSDLLTIGLLIIVYMVP